MRIGDPDGFLTEVFRGFLRRKANARKSVAQPPVSPSFHYHPHHFPVSDWPTRQTLLTRDKWPTRPGTSGFGLNRLRATAASGVSRLYGADIIITKAIAGGKERRH